MLLRASELRIPLQAEKSPLAGPVTLAVSAGDRISITGTSGSGKTTLLRCLAMLDARATGSIEYKGNRIEGDAVVGFRQDVIFVQQLPPRFAMSVEDSLRHAFSFSRSRRTYDQREALKLMDELLLPRAILGAPLLQVSGGEAQRLSLLRALLLKPTILLLDEVTSGLDSDSASCVVQTLEGWFSEGERAGVAVTHGSSVWGTATSRGIRIDSGKLAPEEVS